jgi:hypothetical protein
MTKYIYNHIQKRRKLQEEMKEQLFYSIPIEVWSEVCIYLSVTPINLSNFGKSCKHLSKILHGVMDQPVFRQMYPKWLKPELFVKYTPYLTHRQNVNFVALLDKEQVLLLKSHCQTAFRVVKTVFINVNNGVLNLFATDLAQYMHFQIKLICTNTQKEPSFSCNTEVDLAEFCNLLELYKSGLALFMLDSKLFIQGTKSGYLKTVSMWLLPNIQFPSLKTTEDVAYNAIPIPKEDSMISIPVDFLKLFLYDSSQNFISIKKQDSAITFESVDTCRITDVSGLSYNSPELLKNRDFECILFAKYVDQVYQWLSLNRDDKSKNQKFYMAMERNPARHETMVHFTANIKKSTLVVCLISPNSSDEEQNVFLQ